ncbi:hypothetical protein [Actinomadura violacea]|uniref:Uncharacterized protein n=1 Tax=Actinomadura violacea TaxID=2819934 RepID=A0ABS3RT01_9ACTN|nr:hypothetical protein [Actinomadura violacea]MBO2459853.1 hypothetical protein [Actinomadura violacea]
MSGNSAPMLGSRSTHRWYCCPVHTPRWSKRTLKRRDQREARKQIQQQFAERRR